MILGLEIGMLVWGLIALVTGRLQLNAKQVVEGGAARLIGLVLLLPLPASFAVGFLIGFNEALEGRRFNAADWQYTLMAVEAGVTLGCLAVAFLAAAACGKAPPKETPGPDAATPPVRRALPAGVRSEAVGTAPAPPPWAPAGDEPDAAPSSNGWRPAEVAAAVAIFSLVLVLGTAVCVVWAVRQATPVPAPRAGLDGPRRDDKGDAPRPPKREEPPPPPEILLPDAPPSLEITPSGLDAPVAIKVGRPIGRACLGGGGRYLVLLHEGAGLASAVDLSKGKVTHTFDLGEKDVAIAAGMNVVVAYSPGKNRLTRFDLATGRRQAEADAGLPAGLLSLCVGHSSAGPLLASFEGSRPVLIDVKTLKVAAQPGRSAGGWQPELPMGAYLATGPGRVFAAVSAAGVPMAVRFEPGQTRLLVGGIWGLNRRDGRKPDQPPPSDEPQSWAGDGLPPQDPGPLPPGAFIPAHRVLVRAEKDGYLTAARVPVHDADRPPTLEVFPPDHQSMMLRGRQAEFARRLEESIHVVPRAGVMACLDPGRQTVWLHPLPRR